MSVVIPTFNQANLLRKALHSVVDQTYKNWEIIVVDNYSTDNTIEVMNEFQNKKIKLLQIHNHGVIAVSRNKGIKASKGEWIAFLDSDDLWSKNKIEACLPWMSSKTDFIHHNLEIIGGKRFLSRRRYTKSRQLIPPVLKDLLLNGNTIATSSVMVRKSLIEKVGGMSESVDMRTAEDYNAWLRVAQLTNSFVFVSQPLGFYLFHANGASRKQSEGLLKKVCDEFMPILNAQEKIIFEATSRYVEALHKFHSGGKINGLNDLKFSILNGYWVIRAKSCILLMTSIFQK